MRAYIRLQELIDRRERQRSRRNASPEGKSRSVDWWGRSVGLFALSVSLFNLWITQLRPPSVEIAIGKVVLIKQPSPVGIKRIGVMCNFTNEGARQMVITDAGLTYDNLRFDVSMVSQSAAIPVSGELNAPGKFILFPPMTIKQRDQATLFIWMASPNKEFQFVKGPHTLTLEVFDASSIVVASKRFTIDLTEEDLIEINKSTGDEITINVKSQN